MDSIIRCQFVDSVAFLPCRNPRVRQRDHRWKANMNTLAQAEVRRNRLKNNTTRLSPAPDQAICNCWHKRRLAGYRPVVASLRLLSARRSYARNGRRKWPVMLGNLRIKPSGRLLSRHKGRKETGSQS